jgi:hypothetical protein
MLNLLLNKTKSRVTVAIFAVVMAVQAIMFVGVASLVLPRAISEFTGENGEIRKERMAEVKAEIAEAKERFEDGKVESAARQTGRNASREPAASAAPAAPVPDISGDDKAKFVSETAEPDISKFDEGYARTRAIMDEILSSDGEPAETEADELIDYGAAPVPAPEDADEAPVARVFAEPGSLTEKDISDTEQVAGPVPVPPIPTGRTSELWMKNTGFEEVKEAGSYANAETFEAYKTELDAKFKESAGDFAERAEKMREENKEKAAERLETFGEGFNIESELVPSVD